MDQIGSDPYLSFFNKQHRFVKTNISLCLYFIHIKVKKKKLLSSLNIPNMELGVFFQYLLI